MFLRRRGRLGGADAGFGGAVLVSLGGALIAAIVTVNLWPIVVVVVALTIVIKVLKGLK